MSNLRKFRCHDKNVSLRVVLNLKYTYISSATRKREENAIRAIDTNWQSDICVYIRWEEVEMKKKTHKNGKYERKCWYRATVLFYFILFLHVLWLFLQTVPTSIRDIIAENNFVLSTHALFLSIPYADRLHARQQNYRAILRTVARTVLFFFFFHPAWDSARVRKHARNITSGQLLSVNGIT